jgi:DNA-binding response OmpR family regulator
MDRILCVEDSKDTAFLIAESLHGHPLAFASSLKEALECIAKERFAMYIIDIELPDGTGFELLTAMDNQAKSKPILFLTGRQDFSSKVSAFSLGADDFIVKPFDPKELKLRVESRLKKLRRQDEDSGVVTYGDLIGSPQEQRLRKKSDGSAIELTSLEFRIFHLLAQTPNKIFSRDEILNRVWTDSISVSHRTVDVHVSNLRRKLGGTGVTVETVIGTGYRINQKSAHS